MSAKAEVCYQYDRQGNVLKATGTEGGVQYHYNAFNQQIHVVNSDGSSLESQYDAEGNNVSRYILGYGVAAGWNERNEGYHFYHLDEQNSTVYITGQAGDVTNRYQYDAFGAIRE